MTLSYIWLGFFLVAFLIAFVKWAFLNDPLIFKVIVDGIFKSAGDSVELSFKLIGIMTLFLGFMSIGEKAGAIRFLSRLVGPFFSRLFPEVPKQHPAMGHMMMNFSANLLGLDNAATPFGLKAMESLQELNPRKDVASNPQIMFLALHASGLTIIPVSIIAMRAAVKPPAANPADIFIPCMIATFAATVAALMIVSIRQRINLLQPVILGWILGISALIGLLIAYIKIFLDSGGIEQFSSVLSNGIILLIFLVFLLGALWKKINVFEAFIDGAKGGFEIAVKIIPYLVAMLVAISVLRNSGAFDYLLQGLQSLFSSLGMRTDFVAALPTALMKPLSGSGARGMMIDTMTKYGADSFAGRLSAIFQGTSDTTFYVVAVYFGAVSVKNTRYSIPVMLLADLAGIITAIFVAYLFFGSSIN
jgi:spore maturation protein SpmA